MRKLARHSATVETTRSLEDGAVNPITAKSWSPGRTALLSTRRALPVNKFAGKILELYHKANVFVLSSETGSGKFTQVPQMLAFDEYRSGKQIICTQPRRLAATSLAHRVAQEMDVKLGEEVGFAIGGKKKKKLTAVPTDGDKMFSRVAYMAEGSLINSIVKDKTMTKVCCVIIDEAHERTRETDILLALLKRTLELRQPGDFKVIIMSATLDTGIFQHYFDCCPLLTVPGRSFPIAVKYIGAGDEFSNVFAQAANLAVNIHKNNTGNGDILIFGPGKPQLKQISDFIKIGRTSMEVHTLYSGQSESVQSDILQGQSANRRYILATPIAVASLTIDGVKYVIDTGLCEELLYNPRLGLYDLNLYRNLFRLYTKAAFDDMTPSTNASILVEPLHDIVLKLASLGYPRCMDFDWITPPPPEMLMRAAQDLRNWGLLEADGSRTLAGRAASKVPIEAQWYSSALVEAHKLECLAEMVDLVAISSLQDDIFDRPENFEIVADEAHRMWQAEGSDHLAILRAFWAYLQARDVALYEAEKLFQWCRYRFLNWTALEDALTQQRRLVRIIQAQGSLFFSHTPIATMADQTLILKALTRGIPTNLAICRRPDYNIYHTIGGNTQAQPAAHSAVSGATSEWVVYSKLIELAAEPSSNTCLPSLQIGY